MPILAAIPQEAVIAISIIGAVIVVGWIVIWFIRNPGQRP